MNEFPKVQKFLVDGEIVDMTDDEKDSALIVLDIDESIKEFEYKELFKLGSQSTYRHFVER